MHSIAGVILAAGGSRRLGQPKQLVRYGSETLVHSAARAALEGGCDCVFVITGAAREAVEAALADLPVTCVHHAEWPRGMGSSIRLGIDSARDFSAAILMACDQPALDARLVEALTRTHVQTGRAIVASRYSGTLGIPALFAQTCFAEFESLPDARGAKAIIEAHPERVAAIEFPAGAFDIDSPQDLEAWRATVALDVAFG